MVGVRHGINVQSSWRALRRRMQQGSNNSHNGAAAVGGGAFDSSSQQQQQEAPPPLNALLSTWKQEYIREPQSYAIQPQDVLHTLDEWKQFVAENRQSSSDDIRTYSTHERDDNDDIVPVPSQQIPDFRSYLYILEAAATTAGIPTSSSVDRPTRSDPLAATEFADRLLLRLLQDAQTDDDNHYHSRSYDDDNINPLPTPPAFAMVCKAWASVADPSIMPIPASSKIEEWIERLQALHDEGWPDVPSPNIVFWNMLLSAWSREGNITKIEETLQRMIQNEIPAGSDSGGVSPDTVSFSTLLAAYSRLGRADAAAKADSLLQQMLELYQSGVESAKPNVVSFTNVMQCHAKLGNVDSVQAWLQRLEELYEETLDDDVRPDVAVYNTCLTAFVHVNSPKEAHHFLNYSFPSDVPPNEQSYNIVLKAWAQAGNAYQAEETLREMHDRYVSGELETKPTVVSYNTVLTSYATLAANNQSSRRNNHPKGRCNTDNNDDDAPWKRAENILQHMESLRDMGDEGVAPNERTWNIVLDVCAKSGRADVAERILERLNNGSSTASFASVRAWNSLLSACMHTVDLPRAKRLWNRMQEDTTVQPNIVSYNTYLNCFVRASIKRKFGKGRAHGISKQQEAQAVEAIFRQLCHDKKVTPNRITYLALIQFWISQDEPERAEAVLSEMVDQVRDRRSIKNHRESVVPDRDLFHKVMAAWIPLKHPKKAEALLLAMSDLDEHRQFNLRPNTETYDIVLECWAKSGRLDSGERAEVILREMQALSNSGDKHVQPSLVSYNRVLNAWANSKNPTAVTRTDSLVLEMILKQNSSLFPNAISYNTWVKTITLSKGMDKSKRAADVLKMMKIHDFRPSTDLMKKIQDLQHIKD